MKPLIVISCGVGNDSIALLMEARHRHIRPDLIIFADTGSEHPRTYQYIEAHLRPWLETIGFPALDVVRWIRKVGGHIPLHEYYLARAELPSVAYGFAGCSDKWKRQPIDKFVRHHPLVKVAQDEGRPVERWIGFNADEGHRLSGNDKDDGYLWRAPLSEWDIGRKEVLSIIDASDLPRPGKSSCFTCPRMRPGEVRDLARDHPDHLAIALQIEDAAKPSLHTKKGLGGRFAWRDLLKQPQLLDSVSADDPLFEMPCMCAT
jgi:hypothetical protein